MVFLFVVALFVFAAIGFASVLGSSIGALLFLPILLIKVAFFMMLFGFVGRRVYSTRGRWDWDEPRWTGRSRPRRPIQTRTDEDRFEEWHRMAHAREEVDGWVSDLGEIDED